MSQQKNDLPTPEEMKKFSDQFTEEQRKKLYENQDFLDYFTLNLEITANIANKILKS